MIAATGDFNEYSQKFKVLLSLLIKFIKKEGRVMKKSIKVFYL